MTLEVLLDALVLVLGAITGSFANVCIHRLPRGESVVSPRSHCPACGSGIRPLDNVPVVAWLLLRGRCRDCRSPIPVRYPLVEAGVALLFLASRLLFGLTAGAVGGAILASAAVILAVTDLEHRVLPDEVTLGGLALGLLLALFRGRQELVEALLGAAAGAGVLYLIRVLYKAIRGVEGMGLGDVKMAAAIGALSGVAGVLLTFFFASVAGALFGGFSSLLRTAAWKRARQDPRSPGAGVLLGEDGRISAAGRRWSEIPGAAGAGALPGTSGPAVRPLVAFLRLGRMRRAAGKGDVTSFGRLALDDGDFFRVLAVRVEPAGGGSRLLLWRVDIPFGVFLAAGALFAFGAGRPLLEGLLGWPAPLLGRLLP